MPEAERRGLKFLVEANWLQCLEGELDTAHVSFLHQTFGDDGTGIQIAGPRSDGYNNDRHPRLFALDTDYGFVYGGRRAQAAGNFYWRVTQFLLPFYGAHSVGVGLHRWRDDLDAHRRQPLLALPGRRHAAPFARVR